MNIQARLATDWAVLAQHYRSGFDTEPLEEWANKATTKIRRTALKPKSLEVLETLRSSRLGTQDDLLAFIGASDGLHPLRGEGLPWLDITETQVAKGLAYFLNQDAVHGTSALLRAIAPEFSWPLDMERATIEFEVKCKCECDKCREKGDQSGSAPRIDLLLHAHETNGKQWGAAVELKIRNQKIINPLKNYLTFVSGSRCEHIKYHLNSANAVFFVLAPNESEHTKRRLRHRENKDWFYLDWHSFLRRLEREITQDNPQFRQFRKIIWDKLYV